MVENNVVVNAIVWDGNTNTWTPPTNATMLIQDTTPAMIWTLSSNKTDWVLTKVMGKGEIGFTWDGSVVTTNEPQPAPVTQPATNGTATA